MTGADFARFFARDLKTLKDEIASYPNDASLWQRAPAVNNTGGALARHLAGNLQHFVGAILGHSGYVRDRDAEFARRDVPRATILAEIDTAHAIVASVLAKLDAVALEAEYPLDFDGRRFTTGVFLTQLTVHLGYHLGQIDYHRRFVTGDAGKVQAVRNAAI